jgi:translation initiation factor IF-2
VTLHEDPELGALLRSLREPLPDDGFEARLRLGLEGVAGELAEERAPAAGRVLPLRRRSPRLAWLAAAALTLGGAAAASVYSWSGAAFESASAPPAPQPADSGLRAGASRVVRLRLPRAAESPSRAASPGERLPDTSPGSERRERAGGPRPGGPAPAPSSEPLPSLPPAPRPEVKRLALPEGPAPASSSAAPPEGQLAPPLPGPSGGVPERDREILDRSLVPRPDSGSAGEPRAIRPAPPPRERVRPQRVLPGGRR